MNIKTYLLAALTMLAIAACSHIDESERLIYVKPADVKRHVLLEDFTGQRCINCPKANDEIKALQEQYGEDNVIAVSIHSGPLGFYTKGNYVGLSTQVGDEYYNHWSLDYQPVGLINRSSPTDYTLWATKLREELEKTSNVSISLDGIMADDKTSITVNTIVSGMEEEIMGHLQLWLIEDDITAFQMMPDGTRNDDYHHRHVFRAAINGTWGEEINIEKFQTISMSHTMPLKEEWNVEHISIVAFIYTNEGVIQANQFIF